MSAERKEPPSLAETLWAIATYVVEREKAFVIAAAIALLLAGAGGTVWAQSKLDAGFDEKIEPVLQAVKDERAWREEHLKDDAAFKREVLQRLNENAADTRALYKTVLTGERQPRLEKPVPDAGP